MPWIVNPRSSVNSDSSRLSSADLVDGVPLPSSIQWSSPKTAQAMAAACSRISASMA